MIDGASDAVPPPDPSAESEVFRLINDARALIERRKLADSEAPLKRALKLAEWMLAPDHAYIPAILSHLGWLAGARKQHDQAVAAYRRALSIQEARLGSMHRDTLRSMGELAAALFEAEPHDEEAEKLSLRAIAGYEQAGCDGAELATQIVTLASRRCYVGRYAEAEPLFLRALAMQERLVGQAGRAAYTAMRLAIMYDHDLPNMADPEPYYLKALARYEEAHDDAGAIEARYRLADYLHRQGRDDEAGPLFTAIVAALSTEDSVAEPIEARWMLDGCCQYLHDVGRVAEAEELQEQGGPGTLRVEFCKSEADQAEAAFGSDSVELAKALDSLALAYEGAGQGDQAEEAARRAEEILVARLGPDDPASAKAIALRASARDRASRWAANRPTRAGFTTSKGELFNCFTFPWRDERRPDLVRACLAAAEDPSIDDNGAAMAITAVSFVAGLDEQWDLILELIAEAPENDQVLQFIAAGPLESFLGRFDATVINRVETEAARDPKFRRVLSGVWKHGMSDAVWERVRALQATVREPLPAMRPFSAGEATPPQDA
jgi:tetratricopeptide (TPR) repeat protein